MENSGTVDRDAGEVNPARVLSPGPAAEHAAAIRDAALCGGEIDPAESCRPYVAGERRVGNGDIAAGRIPVDVAAVVAPRVLVRRYDRASSGECD